MKKVGTLIMLAAVVVISQGCGNNNSSTSSGVSGRITKTIKCDMLISGLVGGAAVLNNVQLATTVAITGAGDVFATAEVIDDDAQHNGSSIYATGEIGAGNPSVLVNADYAGTANGGYFDVTSDRNNAGVTVVYTDSSLGVESPVVMTFSNSNCTANNW